MLQSSGFQYLASLAAIFSIAFLVVSLIDLYRRRDIYYKKDSNDRIELMKIKLKMKQDSQSVTKQKTFENAQKIVKEYSITMSQKDKK